MQINTITFNDTPFAILTKRTSFSTYVREVFCLWGDNRINDLKNIKFLKHCWCKEFIPSIPFTFNMFN